MVSRRQLMTGMLAAALPWAETVRAQAVPKRKIGYLHSITLQNSAPSLTLSTLRRQWARLGYVEGETVLLRSAEGDATRYPALIKDMVDQGVGAIIVVGAAALRGAADATKTVPLVAIDLETNPVAAGLAASYARPGGNVTGVFLDQPSLAAKWLDLMQEVVPTLEKVMLLWDPSTGRDQLSVAETQARQRNLATEVVEWRKVSDFKARFAGLPAGRSGLVTLTAPGFSRGAEEIGRAASALRLPAVTFLKVYLGSGILMSYGPDSVAHFARAMVLVERILEGVPPGNLPIEVPTRFEFAIDMKTARTFGLNLPMSFLAQADDVIE